MTGINEDYITTVNYTKGNGRRIDYLVLHYTGTVAPAESGVKYFQSIDRGASAHYFIGYEGEIFRSVRDADIAWHCGAAIYKHPACRNANSIGIELCVKNDRGSINSIAADAGWYFLRETVEAAVHLCAALAEQYGIREDRILRHYDVTGKVCPHPFVIDSGQWARFLDRVDLERASLRRGTAETEIRDVPEGNVPDAYAAEAVQIAVQNGILRGNPAGELRLREPVTRQDLMLILHRCGVLRHEEAVS